MTVADACAELAPLAPMLGPALRRDATRTGGWSRFEATLSPVNTDVLSVMITLRYEIPAATLKACDYAGEPHQPRTMSACLIALPRLADRIRDLGMPIPHRQIEDICRSWVRQTKRALGLYEPGHVLQYQGHHVECPVCEDVPPGQLIVGGYESFPDWDCPSNPPRKEWDARIYCTRYVDHQWARGEWERLELLLRYKRQQQVSA